jgi:NAD(P)-dependent dehydrogenase (short-subunit alcohol dehydrogenase family)
MSDSRPDRGFVVVTGASTGIGAATVAHLAEKGFQVFAGVRREEDGVKLAAGSEQELIPLLLDVADEASIAVAAEAVADAVGERGLAGLVNNAGIVKPGPLEHQPIADFRSHLEVNLIGPLLMIQAFLPLIRRGRGRIVNVGSIGGRMALPLHGGYSASKFGMEGMTDALRLELRQWRIPVSLVDPGAVQTAIFGKTLKEIDGLRAKLGDDAYGLYEAQISAIRKLVEKTAADAEAPVVIAEAVAEALLSDGPETRYLAGHGAKATATMARTMPDHAKDRLIAREVGLPAPEKDAVTAGTR